eukprot:6202605-Pleurochrysis_carterae.AAC.1
MRYVLSFIQSFLIAISNAHPVVQCMLADNTSAACVLHIAAHGLLPGQVGRGVPQDGGRRAGRAGEGASSSRRPC